MNVFRSKKKQALKDIGEDPIGRQSQDSEAMPALKPKKTFRMNKKKDVELPKFELDLVNALPASDDFRTSLLMTGLSARFSMLREQDDPNSKIGKASDDSVLFPRRQSRMNNFNFSPMGLTDIAEVGSIKETRRPFASIDTERVGSSYSQDGFATDFEGSIMNRAKPAEGNVLFGGRQKVYKIPNHASSANKVDGASNGLGSRAIYDDDMGLSAFQRLKLREKEEKERLEAAHNETSQETSISRPGSPALAGYNRNRETSSTTSSGPSAARSSTAATSFMSQRTPSVNGHSTPSTPAVPFQASASGSFIKNRRIHESSNDQYTNVQAAVANGRFEGRGTAIRGPSPDAPRFQSAQRQFSGATQAERSTPAKQPASTGFDFGIPTVTSEPRANGGIAPPLSPPHSEGDDLMLPIQSNARPSMDTPTLIKPKPVYDDAKYQERQLQMQQGRDPPRAFSSRSADAETFNRNRADSEATWASGYDSARSRSQLSTQKETVPRERLPPQARRDVMSPDGPVAAPRFLAFRNDNIPTPALTPIAEPPKPQVSAWEQASAYDEFQDDIPPSLRTTDMPPPSQHPALRYDGLSDHDDQRSKVTMQVPSTQNSRLPSPIDVSRQTNVSSPADSPTLPTPGGLGGLVRQHLRSDSDASSLYDDINKFSPTASSMFSESKYSSIDRGRGNPPPPSGQARFFVSPQDSRAVSQVSDTPSWEKELHRHHSREMSTDTQQERDEFATELAARRRKVQDNLRSFAESESRSQSPVRALTANGTNEAPFAKNNRLNFLKSKTSKSSFVNYDQPLASQLKPMAMLGAGNASSTTINSRIDESQRKSEEEEMMHGMPRGATKAPPAQEYRRERRDERQLIARQALPSGPDTRTSEEHSRRHMEQPMPFRQADYGRQRHTASRPRSPSQARDAPPVSFRGTPAPRNGSQPGSANSSRPGTGDRSSSEGRNNGQRDDRARSSHDQDGMAYRNQEAIKSFPTLPPSGGMPLLPYNGPSPRARADSRTQQFPGYFETQPGTSPHSSPNYDAIPRRQAPVAPFAVNSTAPLDHQSPAGSARSTPVTPHGFQTQHFENQRQAPGERKKSVHKSEISGPQFVSTTSRISTVKLPANEAGAHVPPLPPMDPRRRQQSNPKGMFSSWGRKEESANNSTPELPVHLKQLQQMQALQDGRMNMRSAEGGEYKQPRQQRKLRKISSEGGNLNVRGREAFRQTPSPAVPQFPAGNTPYSSGMF